MKIKGKATSHRLSEEKTKMCKMTKSGNRSNRADLRKQRKKYTVVAQVPAEERIRANQISATLPPVWLCALTHLISVKYVRENTKGTLSCYRYHSGSGAKTRYLCRGRNGICKTTETASHLSNLNNSSKVFLKASSQVNYFKNTYKTSREIPLNFFSTEQTNICFIICLSITRRKSTLQWWNWWESCVTCPNFTNHYNWRLYNL